jgi:hypothetical protein
MVEQKQRVQQERSWIHCCFSLERILTDSRIGFLKIDSISDFSSCSFARDSSLDSDYSRLNVTGLQGFRAENQRQTHSFLEHH